MEKMTLLTDVNQLRVGTRIKIIANREEYSQTTSVKEVIDMKHRSLCPIGQTDKEIIINIKKNRFFSMNSYLIDKTSWVKEVYVLEGLDKRLVPKAPTENDILELLAQKVHSGHIEWWMTSQLILFKNKSATQLISEGKSSEVYEKFKLAF